MMTFKFSTTFLLLFTFIFSCICQGQKFENKRKTIPVKHIHANVNTKNYKDITSYLPKNYRKDGSVDYTQYLQKAFNSEKNILMPNFSIQTSGLTIKSNTKIVFQSRSKLILKPTSSDHYSILALRGVENVEIFNANLEGDYDKHLSNTGEWGYGIDIRGSRNITIENAFISNCWGDGICISSNTNRYTQKIKLFPTENVKIINTILDYNRRNGITIASGVENLLIDNLYVSNTFGTLPKAGIDIEPDNSKGKLDNIKIKNSSFYNNSAGINFHINNYLDKNINKSITIDIHNIIFKDQESAFYFSGFKNQPKKKGLIGHININHINLKNVRIPISRRNKGFNVYPQINFKNITLNNKHINSQNKQLLMEGVNDKENFIFSN